MSKNVIRLIGSACALLLAGCAANLPPGPAVDPATANAPEAATPPWHPNLLGTSQTFLSPAADDREQAAKEMDMSKMNHGSHDMGAMQHSMSGTNPKPTPSPSPEATQP